MPPGADKQARQQRLAAKLRENLRRRKKQADARKAGSERLPETPSEKGKDK
jgi:hypothetical protein